MATMVKHRSLVMVFSDLLTDADGVIKALTPEGLIIIQDVNDPLSVVKQREVQKRLPSLEDALNALPEGLVLAVDGHLIAHKNQVP